MANVRIDVHGGYLKLASDTEPLRYDALAIAAQACCSEGSAKFARRSRDGRTPKPVRSMSGSAGQLSHQ